MNSSWTRILKSIYRKEPITSFVVVAGAFDAALGGLGEHWSLMAVGLGAMGGAIALRWWALSRRQPESEPVADRPPVYVLPPAGSSANLPVLTLPRKNPPRR